MVGRVAKGPKTIDVALYAPRPHQAGLHAALKRFNVLVAHRRFGKTVFCINELIAKAAGNNRPEPRYAYVAPLLTQAKDVAWEYLKRYTAPIPSATAHESELRVDLPGGARIRLYGADNADRLRGLYFDGVVLDEYALMHPRIWAEVIRPALTDREGWAIFIGTPMGRNQFSALYETARNQPEWLAARFKASETEVIPEAELDAARRSMSADQYAQEFECSFDAAVAGAYFARQLDEAERDRRIGRVPWEPRLPVHTAWDLGIDDATTIWFCQQLGNEVRLIDYYESSGVGLAHYAKHLGEMPYVYGQHILPPDAEVRELGSGVSRVETLRSLGIRAEKCARGLEALRQYRHDYDDRLRAFRPRPVHDWTSHAADGFRYLAVGLKADRPPPRPGEPSFGVFNPFTW